MQETVTRQSATVTRTGRAWFWLGITLPLAGIAIYAVRFSQNQLTAPWYMPALATLGLFFLVISIWRRPGVLRIAALVVVALLCGVEWFFLLVMSRLPEYRGPIAIGHPVPAFAALRANGSPFTEKDLRQGMPTVMVLFRGRW